MRPQANYITFSGLCVFNPKQENDRRGLVPRQAVLEGDSGLAQAVEREETLPARGLDRAAVRCPAC